MGLVLEIVLSSGAQCAQRAAGRKQRSAEPLGEIVGRMSELDPAKTAVIHCKGGIRSAKAINQLKEAGYGGRLINVKGGITAWSDDVDPEVLKY